MPERTTALPSASMELWRLERDGSGEGPVPGGDEEDNERGDDGRGRPGLDREDASWWHRDNNAQRRRESSMGSSGDQAGGEGESRGDGVAAEGKKCTRAVAQGRPNTPS